MTRRRHVMRVQFSRARKRAGARAQLRGGAVGDLGLGRSDSARSASPSNTDRGAHDVAGRRELVGELAAAPGTRCPGIARCSSHIHARCTGSVASSPRSRFASMRATIAGGGRRREERRLERQRAAVDELEPAPAARRRRAAHRRGTDRTTRRRARRRARGSGRACRRPATSTPSRRPTAIISTDSEIGMPRRRSITESRNEFSGSS